MKRSCAIGALLLCACAVEHDDDVDAPARLTPVEAPWPTSKDEALVGAKCDPTPSVAADSRALIVQDPEVLERFALERVLSQIIETGASDITPLELLQRVFDTENASADAVFADGDHCDELEQGARVECPRAEGRLARSAALLRAGDPDSFEPIALINRFDLMPLDRTSCGEYRIMYAKRSGRTNPDDRVFLMFEGALANPFFSNPANGDPEFGLVLAPCRSIAELWAELPSLKDTQKVADRLEQFYFEGFNGFRPVVHADSYGLHARGRCNYSGACGQLRVSQGMQVPWQFRQFRLTPALPHISFGPVAVSSTPRTELFGSTASNDNATSFQMSFLGDMLKQLSDPDLARVRLLSRSFYSGFESSLDGSGRPDYAGAAHGGGGNQAFGSLIAAQLAGLESDCPSDDPLTSDAILRRASASTCAGCHAPDDLLAPDRAVGCGMVWPNSLGRAHIDENGKLSEALTQVFLPYRAKVMTTFLRACDVPAIEANLEPIVSEFILDCLVAGTPIAMADGSYKPIEKITAGESVLAFDAASGQITPSQVERAVIRPHADQLITINGTLVATANHPFYTARGSKRAEELEVGDELIELHDLGTPQLSAAPKTIWQLALSAAEVETYNIEVANHHNYFAGGILVRDRP